MGARVKRLQMRLGWVSWNLLLEIRKEFLYKPPLVAPSTRGPHRVPLCKAYTHPTQTSWTSSCASLQGTHQFFQRSRAVSTSRPPCAKLLDKGHWTCTLLFIYTVAVGYYKLNLRLLSCHSSRWGFRNRDKCLQVWLLVTPELRLIIIGDKHRPTK